MRRGQAQSRPIVQSTLFLFLAVLLVAQLPLAAFADTRAASTFSTYFERLKKDPESLRALLKQLPKGGELHSHLSGAVSFERLLDIAVKHKYRVGFTHDKRYVCGFAGPSAVPEWKEPCNATNIVLKHVADLESEERNLLRDSLTLGLEDKERGEDTEFAEFGRIFDRLDALTDNADVMPDLLKEAMHQASEDNVSYIEFRLNPIGRRDSQGNVVAIESLVGRLTAAAAEKNRQLGEHRAVLVKFLVGLNRRSPESMGGTTAIPHISCGAGCPSRLRQAYYLAARRYSQAVVGFDLVGLPETDIATQSPFAVTIDALREEFGPASFTLHAGETNWPDRKRHISEAVLVGARRIGHGFSLEQSMDAASLVCERQIPLEINLTSNLKLGLLGKDELRAHPFPRYFRAEICPRDSRPVSGYLPVTLSTDDAGIFETDLTQELYIATTTFDLTWEEVKLLCRNSLTHAFASESERLALLRRWESEIAQLEGESGWLEILSGHVLGFVRAVPRFFFRLFAGSATLGVLVLLGMYVILYWLYLIVFKKRFMTVAPFRVWGRLGRAVHGEGLAARLSDELMRLQLETVQQSPPRDYREEEPSFYPSEIEFPGPAQVTVEYEGISPEALNSFLRRLFKRQDVITGDVVRSGTGLLLVARSPRGGPWEKYVNNDSVSDVQAALQEIAVRVISGLQPRAKSNIGNALVARQRKAIDEGNHDESVRNAQLALMIAPDSAIDHYNLGIALAKKGENDEAIAAFRKAIRLRKGEYPEAFNSLANRLLAKGQYDKAIRTYSKAVELKKGNYPQALYNLAGAFRQKGELDVAVNTYQEALKLDPTFAEAYYNLGITHGMRDNLGAAVEAFRKATECRPDNAKYHYQLGIALRDSGQMDAARREFARAQDLDPELEPPE
ncbi:MAG: tetratricopeptide repeat protein [Acidobacteria bacterium]|nr:tetratricopeptide repeat protein [Acidobacteriota bacterium]